MIATRVCLSSGDSFYVDADRDDVVGVLSAGGLVEIGRRYVNPGQVTQVLSEEMSTIHVAERLTGEDSE
jgi:hypothetical protein